MTRKSVEDTEKQKERALAIQKKYGVHRGKFTFLMPERLRKLQEQIEAENRAVEETEIKDENDLRIASGHLSRKEQLLNEIEHELLKLQMTEASWVYIQEELSKISLVSNEVAIFFSKTNEGYWNINFATIEEEGKIKPWKTTVIFPDSPFKNPSTEVSKDEDEEIRAIRETEEFKTEPYGKVKKKRK